MNKNIRLAAFDLDGTLVNSLGDLAFAINRAIGAKGFPARALGEFNMILGNGHKKAIERSCPPGTDETTVNEIMLDYLSYYDSHCCILTKPYDGVSELIASLRKRGIMTGIITNKIDMTARTVAEHYFPENSFDIIMGSRDDLALKPDPEPGILMCRQLKVSPSETVYVGDSGSDMVFARNAGFIGVGCTWGFRTRRELTDNGADHIIDHPYQLTEVLDIK